MKKWPGCDKLFGKKAIQAMGGFKVFFMRRALTSMSRTRALQLKPWLRLDHLTFFVDLTYKGVPVISEALPGTVIGKQAGLCFGVRIDPSVITDAVLPRQALTPFFYQGQLYYEQPFQAVHASDYWLNWSAVRSTDHKMACLLHCAPVATAEEPELPWDHAPGDRLCLPLLFQSELGGVGTGLHIHHCQSRLLKRSPFLSFACLDCRPLWGDSLSQPMQFKLVELHLGIWKRCESRAPSLDSVLLTLEQLDWK